MKSSRHIFFPLSPLLLTLFSLFFFFPSSTSAAILGKPPNNLGLVGYWSFNEGSGSIAGDTSGNGSTGTLTPGASGSNTSVAQMWEGAGRFGPGLDMDGTDDFVSHGDISTLSFGTGSFTASAWIKTTDTSNYKTIVMKGASNAGATDRYYMRIEATTGKFHASVGDGSNEANISGVATGWHDGRWHHVAMVVDRSGNTMYTYVDGVQDDSTSIASIGNIDSSTEFRIGKQNDLYYYKGTLDDVRMYSRALTAAQVYSLYKSGSVARKMPNQKNLLGYWSFDEGTGTVLGNASGSGSFNGTITGATWTSLGKKGSALSFDRSADYVNMGGIVLTGTNQPFTMSSWVNPANLTDSWKTIMAGGCTGFDVAISGAALQIGRNCGAPGVFYNVYTFPEANRWYNVVAVYDGTNINAYVDGISYTGGAVTYDNSSTYCIGSYNCGDELFNGKIDEVYLWNRALSAAEITALYTSNNQKVNSSQNTRLTSGLVGLWSFNGGDISNGVALDRSGQGNNGNLINIATSTFYDAGKIGQGFNFDGSNDYVKLPTDISVSGNGTIAFWFNTNAFDKIPIGRNNDNDTYIHLSSATNIAVQTDTTASVKNFTVPTISTGIWYHLAVTRTSDTTRVYLNGVESSTGGQAQNPDYITVNQIGRYGDGTAGYWFNGGLDEVRIYNRGLTAAEVKQLYDMGR